MSAYAEQPFSEFEERYFLAEILKRSQFAPGQLLSIIRDARIEPAWNDIALPHGRSVSACQQAYSALWARTPGPPLPQPSPLGPIDPARGVKRPYSSLGDATASLPRELQPRPPNYPGPNGSQVLYPPPAPSLTPAPPQRKKRGRPTKAEWERRQAEAQERGEIWPKPRKAKARPSTEAVDPRKSISDDARSSIGGGAVGGPALEPSSAGAASAPAPSPDAGRSMSGGPVQPQLVPSRGPEGPDTESPEALPPGRGRLMEGMHHYAQGEPPQQSGARTSPRLTHKEAAPGGSPMQTSPYSGPPPHEHSREQRGR